MPTNARERLLDAAGALFYAEGIRAVGVERLLDLSGVGRASFYRHFASKDDLVVAVIERYDRTWRHTLAEGVHLRGDHPLAVFNVLAERFASDSYRGCLAITTLIEYPQPEHPAHRAAIAHKKTVQNYLDDLLSHAGVVDHTDLAVSFLMLIDAAMIAALRDRTSAPADIARRTATLLLNASEPGTPPAP